jgi:hypothetical protein
MVSRLVSGLRSWVLGVRCWVLGLPKAPPFPRAVRPRPTTRGLKVWHRAVDHVLVVMAYQFVSQTRDLWPDQSDEVCPSKQYRRGQGAFSRQRVVTAAVPCQGILVGASDRNYLRMRARISDAWGRKKTYRIGFGSRASSQRAGKPISVTG